jgi:uncharacterized membrane protein
MEPLVVLAFAIAAWVLLAPLWALISTSRLRQEVTELRRQLANSRLYRERLPGELDASDADVARPLGAPRSPEARGPSAPPPLPRAISAVSGRSADPKAAAAAGSEPELSTAFPGAGALPASKSLRDAGTFAEADALAAAVPPSAAGSKSAAGSAAAAPTSGTQAYAARRVPASAAQRAASREGLERWIGVRGAAMVGGVLLALAAVLLFKHAFERGWIQPPLRIGMGVAGGLIALLVSQVLEKRQLRVLPGALAGAGLVALYASTWASHRLYGYLSATGAMPLFVLITALGGWLAVQRQSQIIAVIGLLGGYATPLLLLVEAPSAANFFGYVLILEVGVLFVALRARFGALPILAVVLGTLLQAFWILRFAEPENFTIVLAALAGQALLFSFVASGPRAARWAALDWSRSLTLALCAGAGLAFAAQGRWQDYGAGQGVLFAAVLGGALYVERRGLGALPLAPLLAITSAMAPALAWWSNHGQLLRSVETARPLALMWLFPLLVLLVAVLFDRRREAHWQRAIAPLCGALIAGLAMNGAARVYAYPAGSWLLTPLLVALLVLTLVPTPALRWTGWISVPPGALLAGLLAGVAGVGFAHVYGDAPASRPWPLYALTLWALLALLLAWLGRGPERSARGAGAALALVIVACLSSRQQPQLDWLVLLAALSGAGAVWLLRRSDQGLATWLALPGLGAILNLWGWQFSRQGHETHLALLALGLQLGLLLLVLARTAPLLRPATSAAPEGAAALATRQPDRTTLPLALLAVLLVWPLDFLWQKYADTYLGAEGFLKAVFRNDGLALPVSLMGALAVGGYALARRSGPRAEASARALWMLAALLLSMALGRVLGGPRASLAMAATLAGWSAFGPRPSLPAGQAERAPTLTLLLALLGLAYAGNAVIFDGYVAQDPLLFSRESLAYAASALFAGLGARRGLAALAAQPAGAWASGQPAQLPRSWLELSYQLLGGAALLFGLATASVLALDCFASAEQRTSILRSNSSSAQTVLSIAWGVYALAVLLLGQRTHLGGLRWASLAVLCLALAKLFLFDLSDLKGLYRVASLLGLGLSLFGVSWIYQRLVFRPALSSAAAEAGAGSGAPPTAAESGQKPGP